MKLNIVALIVLFFSASGLLGQESILEGSIVQSDTEQPVDLVTVYVDGLAISTESELDGSYRLELDIEGRQTIKFSRLGFKEQSITINLMRGQTVRKDVVMVPLESNLEVTITEDRVGELEMVNENTDAIKLIPSTTGNLESVLPHIALGARSGTGGELSSQYNVRGGNYDENLVYVNDFEIFRPQLIRAGQQEGLSFPNIDLMRDLSFSSGGYESKYGDKMASVLDIKYKRAEEFRGSVSGSLLGGAAHVEGSKSIGNSSYQKLRYLVGARYKTNKYLLGSLDTQGEYAPEFIDIQSYLTYDLNTDLQLGLLTNYNTSTFNFIPRTRTTALGLIDQSLQLSSVFEGAERDQFKTGMVGGSLTYLPDREKNPLYIKLLASTYRGVEVENIDIKGFYRLSQVESDINSDSFGEEVAVLGVGTEHDFSRNRLFNRITNIQLKGGLELQSDVEGKAHFIQGGLKYQSELFDDRLNEWERLDSAGYSLPYSDTEVLLNSVLKSENEIRSTKLTGFIQDTYSSLVDGVSELSLTVGTRFSYWDLSGAFNISPRIQFLYKPLRGDGNTSYKLATGIYHQTPFYRELRRPDGSINNDVKPQRSIHIVGGVTKDFIWERISDKPFRFIAEAYYKSFSNLISYDVDNVRLRYSGENDATGTATGIDFRLNGEFVPGAESWFNLSFLSARENLEDVTHKRYNEFGEVVEVSTVPRPSDQSFSMSIYFQDYLPANENIKVFLNMIFGGGLPFGLPDENDEFRNIFRFTAYRRVDMGFGLQLWKGDWRATKSNHMLRGFENAWINLEIFNLMGVENVSSNTWVRTVFSQQYAVPNNLTNRRVNLRFRLDF